MSYSPPPARRFQPTPIEESVRKVRRFAPEPVETTTRSSNGKKQGKKDDADNNGSTPAIPTGVNDSAVERKDFAKKKQRFSSMPVETSSRSSHQGEVKAATTEVPTTSGTPDTQKPRRRFMPELIETTRRSKRVGDSRPATLPTDKTDLTPGVPNIYTRSKRKVRTPANTPHSGSIQILPSAPRRQVSMRPHLNTRRTTRQDSFQPELEAIPSDENSTGSEEDEEHMRDSTPSLTRSLTSSEDSMMRLRLSRTRESCDDRFSGYLLELAAKAAEKQLQDQALAAFPNESNHQIVEHFYDREVDPASDEDSVEGIGMLLDDDHVPSTIRRKSTDVGWMTKELQAHQEKLNRMREEETNAKIAAEATQPTFKDPFWTNGMTSKSAANDNNAKRDAELRCMRSAASPPMLGSDLKFRMCPSPKATKFETDQKIDVQPNKSENGGGLWGGYCVAEEDGEYLSPSTKGPALIKTPYPEREDSDQPAPGAKTPRNREFGVRMLAGIDERLRAEAAKAKAEEALLEEFDDTFVTQVYNYLSLGYPALARQFDAELARISRMSEEELRIDDHRKDAKGYIGIVNGFGGGGQRTTTPEKRKRASGDGNAQDGYGGRWKALRIYILEWATQNPSMSNGVMGPSAWGVRARRGSWAI